MEKLMDLSILPIAVRRMIEGPENQVMDKTGMPDNRRKERLLNNMGAQLNAYIRSDNARVQAEFYKEALGGEIIVAKSYGEIPGTPEAMKDKIMHLAVSLAGSNILMLSDAFEPLAANRSINLGLSYDSEFEARTAYEKLGEGGELVYPFELQPWGAYYGEVVDKFGVTWQIVKQ
ncbi:VOC family protein [Paenibacillus sp. SAF-054]